MGLLVLLLMIILLLWAVFCAGDKLFLVVPPTGEALLALGKLFL